MIRYATVVSLDKRNATTKINSNARELASMFLASLNVLANSKQAVEAKTVTPRTRRKKAPLVAAVEIAPVTAIVETVLDVVTEKAPTAITETAPNQIVAVLPAVESIVTAEISTSLTVMNEVESDDSTVVHRKGRKSKSSVIKSETVDLAKTTTVVKAKSVPKIKSVPPIKAEPENMSRFIWWFKPADSQAAAEKKLPEGIVENFKKFKKVPEGGWVVEGALSTQKKGPRGCNGIVVVNKEKIELEKLKVAGIFELLK